jgi:hypothetical protein
MSSHNVFKLSHLERIIMNCGELDLTASSLNYLGLVCSTVIPLGAQDTLTQEFCIQVPALVLCFFALLCPFSALCAKVN